MCGIAGFFTSNNLTKEQKESVFKVTKEMFVSTQSRGTDASGFSYIDKHKKLITVKGPIAAKKMVEEQKFAKLNDELPNMLMMHCRSFTVGHPINNFNNHPVITNKKLAIIHNGTISNHIEIKKHYDLKSKGSVDSEVIPLSIYKHTEDLAGDFDQAAEYDLIRGLNMATKEFDGGFACAMINENHPEILYLFNHRNPIVLAYVEELGTIFFASEKSIIEDGIKKIENSYSKFGIFTFKKPSWTSGSIDNDTITTIKFNNGAIEISGYDLEAQLYKGATYINKLGNSVAKEPTKKEVFYQYGANTKVFPAYSSENEDWRQQRAGMGCGV